MTTLGDVFFCLELQQNKKSILYLYIHMYNWLLSVLLFQELEKKVSQTNPFKNLKQMLLKKNDQLKELRKRLSK